MGLGEKLADKFKRSLGRDTDISLGDLKERPAKLRLIGARLADSCQVAFSKRAVEALAQGRLSVRIKGMKGGKGPAGLNSSIRVGATRGQINMVIGAQDVQIHIGDDVTGQFALKCHAGSRVVLGDRTTAQAVMLFAKDSSFVCGSDCMFSSSVLCQTSDQHGIIDLETGGFIQKPHPETVIGDHVWIGRRAMLMPGGEVGSGSIVGAGAIVTSPIAERCLAVGVPARTVRENVSWSREPDEIDPQAGAYLDSLDLPWR